MCTTVTPAATSHENTRARLPVTPSWIPVRDLSRHQASLAPLSRHPPSPGHLSHHRASPDHLPPGDWRPPHRLTPGRIPRCRSSPTRLRRGFAGSGNDGGASDGGSPLASASRFTRPCIATCMPRCSRSRHSVARPCRQRRRYNPTSPARIDAGKTPLWRRFRLRLHIRQRGYCYRPVRRGSRRLSRYRAATSRETRRVCPRTSWLHSRPQHTDPQGGQE